MALASIVWAFVADAWGRARTMILGLSLATLLGLCLPWVSSYPLLLGLRVFEGIFLAAVTGVAISFIVSVTHFSAQVTATSLFISGTSLGGLVGRLVSGVLVELVGWRWTLMAVSILATCAASFFAVLLSRGALAQAAASFNSLTKPNATKDGFSLTHLVQKLWVNLKHPKLLLLYFAAFSLMGAFVSIYNYIGFVLEAPPYSLPVSLISFLFLTYLFGTFSSATASKLARRFSAKKVLVACSLLMAGGIALTALSPLPVIIAGLVILTTGFFAAHALASGQVGIIATRAKTQATALYNVFYYVGSASVGWATGLLLAHEGWTLTAASCGTLVLLSATLIALFFSPRA
ncbi:MFS transporter [Rothia terrae]|uniref:MFS transporter n=1 Tax=Rothia terrae TaxID=396015 RepID=UPI0028816778|nr:MFS transporter [Rothia terrae]MDT0190446.1 MFS transporter [Rothia terrae]